MKNITFLFRRLKAMSLAEIFYRLLKELYDRKEYNRLTSIRQESKINFLKRHGLLVENSSFELGELAVFEKFKKRNFFRWQEVDKKNVLKLFSGFLSENKIATIQSAKNALDQRFKVFDRELFFEEKIDWCRDPVSFESLPNIYWKKINIWDSSQIKEVKYVWEINRLQHFVTLAKAFYLTDDEKYAEVLINQWRDWLEKNPYLIGINWCSALENTFRIISWTWVLQFAKKSIHVTPEFYTSVLIAVEQHANYIEQHLSRFSSANNHLIGEALGLIYAGCYFPELSKADHWKNKGFAIFESEIIAQVFPDGVAKEQATHYQRYLIDFTSLGVLAAEYCKYSFSAIFMERCQKMVEFSCALMDENGNVPNIGDEDGGSAIFLNELETKYSDSLSAAACLLQNNNKGVRQPQNEFFFWMTGNFPGKPESLLGPKKQQPVQYFPQGGYVVYSHKIKNCNHHLIMDVGPQGLGKMDAHGHADALSLLLHVNGQPVLIDCGTYLYLGSRNLRDFFRGTAAHNTVMVNNEHQAEPIGPFQWGRKVGAQVLYIKEGPDKFAISAEHNGYLHKGITHQRTVTRDDENGWILKDKVLGPGISQIDLYFHLAPCYLIRFNKDEVVCEYNEFTVKFCFSSKQDISIIIIDNFKDSINWYSPSFGKKIKHPVLKISTTNKLPVEITTKINVQ